MADDGGRDRDVVEVALPNGVVALVRAVDAGGGGGATKVSARDRFDLDGVAATVGGVAESIRSAVDRVGPRLVRVEFGVEMAVRSGKLTGLLVEGDGAAALRVTLEWGERAGDGEDG